jgi:Restriction endonuclease
MAKISGRKIKRFFNLGDTATTRPAKGKALEDLVCYLFGCVPGISVTKRNAVNVFTSEEIDVAFWNDQAGRGFYFLPWTILVECKNWSSAVGAAEVGWFDSKLKRRGLEFGVLVSANGITGTPDDISAAHEIIRNSLSEGRKMVVITRTEIESLGESSELVKMVKEKLCELAVSGTLFLEN